MAKARGSNWLGCHKLGSIMPYYKNRENEKKQREDREWKEDWEMKGKCVGISHISHLCSD